MQKLSLTKKYDVYPKYKNILLEESETIPSHWNVDKLSNIGFIPKERNSGGELLSVYLDRGVIRASDGSLGTHAVSEDLSKYQAVKKGDLVLNNQQAWRGSVGVSELEGIISPAYILFRFKQDTFPRYYNYLCRSALTIDQFRLHSKGVGNIQRQIQGSALKNVKTIIPPTEEQERIARFLDEQTARIDETIAKKERLIKLLKEKRTAVINHAVTRGIDTKVELVDSGIEWIDLIPKNWKTIKLKFIGQAIIGLTYSPEDVVSESGTLVLRSSNVQQGNICLDDNVFVKKVIPKKLLTRKGDILICSRNGSKSLIGKNALIDENNVGLSFGAFMTVFRTENYPFISYFLKSNLFMSQLSTTLTSTINQLTTQYLNNIVVALPPDREQEEIVAFLDKKLVNYEASIKKVEDSIVYLRELKSSLISHAVTGKIKI